MLIWPKYPWQVAPLQSPFPFVPALESKATYFLNKKLNAQAGINDDTNHLSL